MADLKAWRDTLATACETYREAAAGFEAGCTSWEDHSDELQDLARDLATAGEDLIAAVTDALWSRLGAE